MVQSLHTPSTATSHISPSSSSNHGAPPRTNNRTLNHFTREVELLLTEPLNHSKLLQMSEKLQEQFKVKLQAGSENMLPSYNHLLPTGSERGTFLSLDVGGSTLRVAIVTLAGREHNTPMKIQALQSWRINDEIKALEGRALFDWMADCIDEMLMKNAPQLGRDQETPLDIGLAWSFPLEYVACTLGICSYTDLVVGKHPLALELFGRWEKASRDAME